MFDFEQQLKILPDKPGVYLMKNSLGEVIYVGKAKILKNRVRQYFQKSKNHSEKVRTMVKHISEFEYIVTDSEMEALVLECNLIKKYRPRYNILLKDDKIYPLIKITLNEDFPRIICARNKIKDGARYFGPYISTGAVYETMEVIKKIFPIRDCKLNIKKGNVKVRPCLNYHIGLCKAPCTGHISKEEYGKIISGVMDFLSGKNKDIIRKLKEDMDTLSENMEFEKAAELRDKIFALEKIIEKQKITTGGFEDEDFINIHSDEKDSCIQVFFSRTGKIIGREHFIIEDTQDLPKGEIVANFIKEFYGGTAYIAKTIYVPEIYDVQLLEDWLSIKKDSKVYIKIPQKGDKKAILNLVEKNARTTLQNFKLKFIQDKKMYETSLEELMEILNLDDIPHRIEAYDVSNIQGVDSVGTMVVFENGRPKHNDYRRFKINEVKGANDYESMKEILRRRFQNGMEEIKRIKERKLEFSAGKFSFFPDLILMDGGKIQVSAALEVLKEFNIDITVCGMVKDDKHRTRGLIYRNEEMPLNRNSNIIKLITRIQDEVHRFAVTYHRSLRSKRVLHSVLEDIPNVGVKRRKELLKRFLSVENIKKASMEELISTPSIDMRTAESIISYFRGYKS